MGRRDLQNVLASLCEARGIDLDEAVEAGKEVERHLIPFGPDKVETVRARVEAVCGSASKMARIAGVSKSTVSGWMKDTRELYEKGRMAIIVAALAAASNDSPTAAAGALIALFPNSAQIEPGRSELIYSINRRLEHMDVEKLKALDNLLATFSQEG